MLLRSLGLLRMVCWHCCPGLAASTTWHVSSSAASGGDGTQGKPFENISSGAAVAMPGEKSSCPPLD